MANFIYRRRPVRRDPAVIAAEKAAAAAQAKTCQVCGRAIFAEAGVIAHHGYERPGEGWQTASCTGARELPFEVQREKLGQHIMAFEQRRDLMVTNISELAAEARSVRWTYHDYTKPRDRRGRTAETSVQVTRETWAAEFEAYKSRQRYKTSPEPTFDYVLERELARCRSQLASTIDYIAFQKARYDGWQQTHRRGGEGEATWVAL